MTPARVKAMFRHTIKAHGVEAVTEADFAPGTTMPWDRVWAIAHEAARLAEDGGWSRCVNFSRGAKSPGLMAIRARVNEAAGTLTLTRPGAAPIEVDPDEGGDAARLLDWVMPLAGPGRARPARVVRANGRGMTDSDFPSVSILNAASLAALSQRIGRPLAMERFRGNIWLEGLAPWEEFDLVGREIRIGEATFTVRERITRCKATTVDPATGRRDADTLGTLEAGWGHRDFGVYAQVTGGGRVAVGDAASASAAAW